MNALARKIAKTIAWWGPVSFADFMEFALYDPQHGYYRKPTRQTGRQGDFFTSVSVGSFFGELLAFQFARWFDDLSSVTGPVHCVEAGAHDGRLAFDILEAMEDSEPSLFGRVQYWIVEPSHSRRCVQQRVLERFRNVRWFESFREISGRVHGVIFSNELLDAMPVHVFRWNASMQCWHELGVGVAQEQFTWTELPWESIGKPRLPKELLAVLPHGFTVEMSMGAIRYWAESAGALAQGRLMTIDYGGTLDELLSPSHLHGTLRAYSGHRLSLDVLKDPGEQDITAHVNFSELRRVGEAAGLQTETFKSQSQFLTGIAREFWAHRESLPQPQVRQFQTLTHPEHLGRPFRVLVQSRSGHAPS